jgi:RimJ/RimL family protein N-acetyltransferase
MTVTFRTLQIEDYQIYASLRLACLKNFPDNFGTTYEEEADTSSARFQKFKTSSANTFLFGAFDGQNLVGIVGFERAGRRKTRHRGEIVQMYVSPDYTGHKIGTSLLRKVIEIAFEIEGIEQLELSVVSNNASAIKLYEKCGFKSYGVHPYYFKDGSRYWHQQFMQLLKSEYQT